MIEKNTIFNPPSISYSRFLNSETDSQTINNLDFFRQSSSYLSQNHIYIYKKRQAYIYRWIFLGFSLLFFALGLIVFLKSMNGAFNFYLGNGEMIKTSIYSLCLILSASSMGITWMANPEREAAQILFSNMRRNLIFFYKEQQRLLSHSSIHEKRWKAFLHDMHNQALDNLEESYTKNLELLSRITHTKGLARKIKDQLFNQAIHELHTTLQGVVSSFKDKAFSVQIGF